MSVAVEWRFAPVHWFVAVCWFAAVLWFVNLRYSTVVLREAVYLWVIIWPLEYLSGLSTQLDGREHCQEATVIPRWLPLKTPGETYLAYYMPQDAQESG
jgi:hypothetical protein